LPQPVFSQRLAFYLLRIKTPILKPKLQGERLFNAMIDPSRNRTDLTLGIGLVLLLQLGIATAGERIWAAGAVPLLYCTDLFHPHDDPDDHFDLATIYAIPEFDLKGIVLDQGAKQLQRPGRIPVSQLNHLTGREVPVAIGLEAELKSPEDKALDQPQQFQGGVRSILDTLRAAARPVAIATVGSVRDVTAAYNREPALLRQKVGQIMIFIGEASRSDFREHNVGLDPHAFVGLMRSGLPIYWVPCFDGGLWRNEGHASFWQARHADLLGGAPAGLLQYFIYALEREKAQSLEFLAKPVDPARKAKLFAGTRNLWCTAIFGSLAGRRLEFDGHRFVSRPARADQAPDTKLANDLYAFEEVQLAIGDDAVVCPDTGPNSRRVWRFVIRDRARYAPGLTEATAELLGRFPVVQR
jgi:hypothetical protein